MDSAAAAANASAGAVHSSSIGYELQNKYKLAVQQLKEAYAVLLQRLIDKTQQRSVPNEQQESEASDKPLQLAIAHFFALCDEIEIICNTAFRAIQLEKQSELVTQTVAVNYNEAGPFSTYSNYLQLANAHTQFANEIRNSFEQTLEALRHQRVDSYAGTQQQLRAVGAQYAGITDSQALSSSMSIPGQATNLSDQQAPLSRLQHLLSNPDFSSSTVTDRSDQTSGSRNPYSTMDF